MNSAYLTPPPPPRGHQLFPQNQAGNLDGQIEDVLEHFVYVPKKCTANPQDIPFFLSTRLVDAAAQQDRQQHPDGDDPGGDGGDGAAAFSVKDPVKVLRQFEDAAADVSADFEANMVRF